jgi:hypothetical protein
MTAARVSGYLVIPTPITDTNLIGSSILENEHPEWAPGGFDAVTAINRNHIGICISTSGRMWKAVDQTGLYYSDDSGVTWTAWTSFSAGNGVKTWRGICARGTGIYISVGGVSGSIWKITAEAGTCTDLAQTARDYNGMAVCPDGHVWCIIGSGDLYKQTNGAGNFAKDVTIEASTYAWHIHITAGNKFYVSMQISSAHYIYYRGSGSGAFADLGAAVWPTTLDCRGLTSNSNGDIFCAANNDSVYVRAAGAGNFTSLAQTARPYRGMCCDNLNNLFVVTYGGYVYKATGSKIYSSGDYCQVVTSTPNIHKIYQSITDNNIGNEPTATVGVNWQLIGYTMRWKAFDGTVGAQADASESALWVFAPGLMDAVSILNHESSSIDVIEIDNDDNLITNGDDFTGATGTTPPTGWSAVGTPADFLIDSGAVKITTDAAGEGMSETKTVTPGTRMQFLLLYKNTTGDVCQVKIEDITHSSNILAATDLASATSYAPYSYVFTVPAGCTSIKVSLLGKGAGDIVWFDYVKFAPVIYSETITTGSEITDSHLVDLVQEANCIITVTVNNTGATAKAGEISLGLKKYIGSVKYGGSFDIKSYSTITTDVYGHDEIVKRNPSKRATVPVEILKTNLNALYKLFIDYESTPLIWIFDSDYNLMTMRGYYIAMPIVDENFYYVTASMEIQGMT